VISGIAAAVITVVGVVFSIILVTLTLASTQFGPRMLRNFIRDRGTQLTLGTFVATFVYAMLVLVSIGPGSHGNFVPHIGVTVTLTLMVADLGVLIYFINHTATSIQLPQVIASIARDLSEAIEVQGGPDSRVSEALGSAHITGPYRTLTQDISFGVDQVVEIAIRALSPAVNDTFTALTCIDWLGDSLCKITGRWHPALVHRDSQGFIRVITAEPSHERLVQRAFEKIRQASLGMPAVMIRQLEALAKIMADEPVTSTAPE
jgi:uncharacterized membrane protein